MMKRLTGKNIQVMKSEMFTQSPTYLQEATSHCSSEGERETCLPAYPSLIPH